MAGEDAPNLARILHLLDAYLQILQGDTLAHEHAEDVVIGLHKELCRIGKRFVVCKPGGLSVPMRANDRQPLHMRIEGSCNLSRTGLGGKQTVYVDQHDLNAAFRREAIWSDH